ncbi:MAG: ATP synthase F1 subunit gamma [Calditrichales bacterium]|nr:MAG: ATP synthase F1 subunit gamma [Calditrichales bacterium]
MATLREIRTRIASVKSTQQITKAMKMVAAAKLRKAQEKIIAARPYVSKMQGIVGHLVGKLENGQHPLLVSREIEKVLLVIVTSDRGLCGGFNANLIRHALKKINTYADKEVSIYVVGKKGYEFFSRRDYRMFNSKINIFNHLNFQDALEIAREITQAYMDGQFDQVDLVYNAFKSAVSQNLTVEQFLPFKAAGEASEKETSLVDYLYEPTKGEILDIILPKQLNVLIWKILLESNASEQGARMTAMESATDNAEDLISNLTLHYNRARQAAITKEISEIVGGAEALKEK